MTSTLHIDKIVEKFPTNYAAGTRPPPPTYYCHRKFGKKEYVVLSGAWDEIAPVLFRLSTTFSDRVEILCESGFARDVITKVILKLIGRKGKLMPDGYSSTECPVCGAPSSADQHCVALMGTCNFCGYCRKHEDA